MDTTIPRAPLPVSIVKNNVRTLSTLSPFFSRNASEVKRALHPRSFAEKANAAHLGIVSINYEA